jgi:leader peptidase (prepilin peptidase)/N-methyltransferase
MPPDWAVGLFLILVSPAVGSFLGVLVDRLPQGQDVLTRASRCATCGARLRWSDMVPIASALLRGGRCRDCGAPIPAHLLRIELAAVVAAVIAVVLGQGPVHMVVLAGFLWCLVALFYCDLGSFRLPDALTAALALFGFGLAVLDPARGALDGLISAVFASGAFLAIRWGYRLVRKRDGLGLGDVKMMAGIGAGLGWSMVPTTTLLAASLALAVTALEALRSRRAPDPAQPLPFGCYLAGGAVLTLLL